MFRLMLFGLGLGLGFEFLGLGFKQRSGFKQAVAPRLRRRLHRRVRNRRLWPG